MESVCLQDMWRLFVIVQVRCYYLHNKLRTAKILCLQQTQWLTQTTWIVCKIGIFVFSPDIIAAIVTFIYIFSFYLFLNNYN
jgi:hypothetical protein